VLEYERLSAEMAKRQALLDVVSGRTDLTGGYDLEQLVTVDHFDAVVVLSHCRFGAVFGSDRSTIDDDPEWLGRIHRETRCIRSCTEIRWRPVSSELRCQVGRLQP
jgi:hypothetical protein